MEPEPLWMSGRVLLLAAHPDDEVIGAGGQLRRWRDRILLVQATDGSPRDRRDAREYAETRRAERREALAVAGIAADQSREIGIPDQRAACELPRLIRALAALMDEFLPDWILTHPYEGGHPDHDACAFAARAAAEQAILRPKLVEFTSYHAGPGGGTITGEFLAAPTTEVRFDLDESQTRVKHRMFECYRTQQQVLAMFRIGEERFRVAPEYDFSAPPHDGRLNYENWNLMEGRRWRELAAKALEILNLHHGTYHT